MKVKIEIEVEYPKANGKNDAKEIRWSINRWFKEACREPGFRGGLDALNADVVGDTHFKAKIKLGNKVVINEKWKCDELEYSV